MKTLKKVTVWVTTLAVGIGLFVGSMGVASASPHHSDWNGPKANVKAPATSPAFGNNIDTKFTDGDTEKIKLMWREDGANRALLIPVPTVIR